MQQLGEEALKAGKYLWSGAVAVAGLSCCIGATVAVTPGCVICVGTATIVGEYVHDKLENHCD